MYLGPLTALLIVAGVLAFLVCTDAEASVYVRDRPSDKSRFMFTTKGNVVSKMHLISPKTCADGSRGTIGITQGIWEPGTLDLPIRRNGRFSYTQRSDQPGDVTKVRARVSKDWVNGRWFARWRDPWDSRWCWTGKSIRNPWVRLGALRVGTAREPGRG
jgi:hypothetical protein